MPQWLDDLKGAFWTRMGELAAGVVVSVFLIGLVAALAWWLGPELASRYSVP